MQIKQKELIKIALPNALNTTFNQRERHLNVEIQKLIDSYNQRGFTVVERETVTKSSSHATVRFVIQKLM